jgi:hypothetical protein
MWQHEEAGRVGFVDAWQLENGWEQANPRLRLIRPLVFAAAPSQAPTDLHAAILNLPCNVPPGYPFGSELCAGVYRQGHRDARHTAAELVAAASQAPQEQGHE